MCFLEENNKYIDAKNSNFDLESALREYAFQFILPGSAMDYTELQHKVINMWWSMNRP